MFVCLITLTYFLCCCIWHCNSTVNSTSFTLPVSMQAPVQVRLHNMSIISSEGNVLFFKWVTKFNITCKQKWKVIYLWVIVLKSFPNSFNFPHLFFFFLDLHLRLYMTLIFSEVILIASSVMWNYSNVRAVLLSFNILQRKYKTNHCLLIFVTIKE